MRPIQKAPQGVTSRLSVKFRDAVHVPNASTFPVEASKGSVLLPATDEMPIDLGTKDLALKNTFLSGLEPCCNLNKTSLASRIKGTCGVVQKYQTAFHIFSKESLVYHCRYFKLNYYPPEHFLGVFRKSKPAVNVKETGDAYFNNNLNLDNRFHGDMDLVQKRAMSLFRNNPSFLPRQYAVYRRRNRVFVREHMIQEWCRLNGSEAVAESVAGLRPDTGARYIDAWGRTKPGVAKDGFYVYQTLIFPEAHNHKELSEHIKRSVKRVAHLQWDEYLYPHVGSRKSWVQAANDRVKTGTLNKLLAQNEHPFVIQRDPVDEA